MACCRPRVYPTMMTYPTARSLALTSVDQRKVRNADLDLVRPGTATQSGLQPRVRHSPRRQQSQAVRASGDGARSGRSIKLLTAAIEAKPADRLTQSKAGGSCRLCRGIT